MIDKRLKTSVNHATFHGRLPAETLFSIDTFDR